jgi:phosphoenolpyruvate synthase/pyruvate phosphate dikinase
MVSGVYFLVGEYAKRLNIPLDVLLHALWEEIFARDIDEKRLRARMKQSVFFWKKEKTEIFEGAEGNELSILLRQLIYGKPDEIKEIKGICASPGKAIGRAVIAMSPNDFHKVKNGDILFTMMTRPEFLPVMNMAAAFVTDEGGITSHAAIIAREMKKPCIIATKKGTKIVKDGDLVEVDAERGIVKILK